MAIDDHPVEVLRKHFELENASAMPFAGAIITALQAFPHRYRFLSTSWLVA